MPNMSYCRFQNTLADLRDCREHLLDKLSREEDAARARLISLCNAIVNESDDMEMCCEDDGEEEEEE